MTSEERRGEAPESDDLKDSLNESNTTKLNEDSKVDVVEAEIELILQPLVAASNGESENIEESRTACTRHCVSELATTDVVDVCDRVLADEAFCCVNTLTTVEGGDEQEVSLTATPATASEKEMVTFKLVYNKQNYNVTFPLDETVFTLKKHVQELTDVQVTNQKILFKGLMNDEGTLRSHQLTNGAKLMVVGSKVADIQSVSQTSAVKAGSSLDKSGAATSSKEPLSRQKPHKTILDKYGKPDDAMIGIKNRRDALPPIPLCGMYNKVGHKVRLTFKLESDQVWIGTKERTEKVSLSSIKTVVSEPIDTHEEYHLLGIQTGTTEASRYWIYWVPAQYVDSIKDAVLGNWPDFSHPM